MIRNPEVCRRQTPRVRQGTVRRKNGHALNLSNYYRCRQSEIVIDRERPGEGYRHVLTVDHVRRFLALLPEWDELSAGLNAMVLAPGEDNTFGWHMWGVVALCAWPRELWMEHSPKFCEDHRSIFDRLALPREPIEDARGRCWIRCDWTVETARAFLLVHVLLHELGHHHDRITTHTQHWCSRGEPYAEAYALRYEEQIWDRYVREFPDLK